MQHSDFLFQTDNASFTNLEISSERPEPLFWGCEIRFLTKFPHKRKCEIRRIHFRKGLDIVWAMPSNEYHAEDEQRIAGHANPCRQTPEIHPENITCSLRQNGTARPRRKEIEHAFERFITR